MGWQWRVTVFCVLQIRGEYEAIQAEHSQLQKSIEALKGLEVWRREVDQYEQVTWREYCCVTALLC